MAEQHPVTPENVRKAVEMQPTVAQGITALLRGVSYSIQHGGDGGAAWAKAFDTDPKSWSDAVLANTPDATATAVMLAPVPTDVQPAMAAADPHAKAPAHR